METAASFETQLSELFRARFPMVYIPTWEEERALSAIRSLANDPNLIRTVREVLVWRVTTGILEQSTQKIIKDTTDPLKARQLPATEVASLRESFDTSICLDRPGLLHSQSCEVQQRSGNYQSH